MPKLKTTRVRRKDRTLHVQVMSSRIMWFEFLAFCTRLSKFAIALAVIAALGWGAYLGIRRGFIDNQEFRLQTVDLNANPAIDEARLVEVAGINLNSGIFHLQPGEIRKRLAARPELSAVTVARQLPGTLIVRVTAREPIAWLVNPATQLTDDRAAGGWVVDRDGAVFECQPGQMETSINLPVIVLPKDEPLMLGMRIQSPTFERLRHFLAAARECDPSLLGVIDRVEQTKSWAIEAKLRDGIQATFGLGDFERQLSDLMAARAYAEQHNQQIATINLIPQRNIPVTLREEPAAQGKSEDAEDAKSQKGAKEQKVSKETKAATPERSKAPAEDSPNKPSSNKDRRSRDVKSLLNRN